MTNSKRRRNRKLFASMERAEASDERINVTEKAERRKVIFGWSAKKKRRWCKKYG